MTVLFRAVALLVVFWLAGAPLDAKTRKGDKLLKEAEKAEGLKEYDRALSLYEQALATDFSEPEYQLRVRKLRFAAGQAHIDTGKKLRDQGKLEEALTEYQKAFAIDPASALAENEIKRTYEMLQRDRKRDAPATPEKRGMTPAQEAQQENEEKMASFRSVPELKPLNPQITNLKMTNQNTKVLFETVAKLAGINVLFDPDFITAAGAKTYSLDLTNSTIEDALDYLSLLTKAFWKPISANAIFVTQDQVTKRRDFEDNVVRVFYLQNATAQAELNEIAAALRAVTEIRRLLTYQAQMAILIRGTTEQVALAEKLIYDLDKPKPEVVIDIVVIEAVRGRTRELAATFTTGGAPGLNVPITYTGGGESGSIPLGQISSLTTNDFSLAVPGAIIRALLNDRTTRVLQNPQLRTLDAQKATLKIGDRYPYATGSFQPGIGVGGGGVSPLVSTQFQFAEIGVNVDVTPKIHANNEVSMHIEVELSNIADRVNVGGLEQPVIGQRKIFEDIRLKEGEVSVLGGLSGLNTSKSVAGLPGLATLPGIGWLFGSQSNQLNQTELIVLLTPRVVRPVDVNEINLRTISAGNDQVIRLSRAARPSQETAAQPASAPAPAAVPAPAPAVTAPAPPAPPQAQLMFAPAEVEVSVGAPVSVTLDAQGAVDLFSAPFRIDYDKTRLKLVDITRGPLMAEGGQPVSFVRDVNTGVVRINRLPGAGGASGSGGLVSLVFEALTQGKTVVTVSDPLLQDSKMQPLSFRTSPLTITIN